MRRWVQLFKCTRCGELIQRDVSYYMNNEKNVQECSDEMGRANMYLNTGHGIYHACDLYNPAGTVIYGFAENVGLEAKEFPPTAAEKNIKGGM